jgi:hypothetical protein
MSHSNQTCRVAWYRLAIIALLVSFGEKVAFAQVKPPPPPEPCVKNCTTPPPPEPCVKNCESTPPPSTTVPPIPELTNWQGRMTYYGAWHCNEAAINAAIGTTGVQTEDNVWYYDGTKVYQQIAAATGNPGWYTCARYTNTAYRSWVLAVTANLVRTNDLQGHRVFPHGLANDYWRTGDPWSREAVIRLSKYSAWANSGGSLSCGIDRETAYILEAYLTAEELGEAPSPQLPVAVDNALGQLSQQLVTRTCLPPSGVKPFLMGLVMEALIRYYEHTSDPRIPPAVEVAADNLWTWLWDPASQSFFWSSTCLIVECGNQWYGTPELNLLIAPAYAWLWQLTGAPRHLERGDAIFAGGVQRAWIGAGKAFSQSYRWSFDYVKWRSYLPGTFQPPTRY